MADKTQKPSGRSQWDMIEDQFEKGRQSGLKQRARLDELTQIVFISEDESLADHDDKLAALNRLLETPLPSELVENIEFIRHYIKLGKDLDIKTPGLNILFEEILEKLKMLGQHAKDTRIETKETFIPFG